MSEQGLDSENVYHHIVNLIYTDWVAYASKKPSTQDQKDKWYPVTTALENPGSLTLYKTKRIIYCNWSEDSNSRQNELLF